MFLTPDLLFLLPFLLDKCSPYPVVEFKILNISLDLALKLILNCKSISRFDRV